ncbi:D-alanine--D-alanine ligase [Patescibacteria group bacterium]|nr:D-alanine--D-alanine ligase [Patescibacteria group bacterium]
MVKKNKLRIGVLFGGRSAEHEVSLVSAASVIKHLDKKKYQVVPIGLSKEGIWLGGSTVLKFLKNPQTSFFKKEIVLLPEPNGGRFYKRTDIKKIQGTVDVIWPVLHGTFGEDGIIQGFLELTDLPYVGAGVLGSAVAMDKIIQKLICQQAGLPVLPFVYTNKFDYKKSSAVFIKNCQVLKYPMFVKPANLGSSVGISKVNNLLQLKIAINLAFKYDRRILVEQAVKQPLEIECSVLGNNEPQVSVLGQVIPSNEFYDYDAKYVDGKSNLIIPAPLSKTVSRKIKNLAVACFKVLDLKGLARIDFLVSQKSRKIYLNEPNTMPGFTSISMYPKLWGHSGLGYSELLDRLISLALANYQDKKQLQTSYKPTKQWYQ